MEPFKTLLMIFSLAAQLSICLCQRIPLRFPRSANQTVNATHVTCEKDAFFDTTVENIEASGVKTWFPDFDRHIDKKSSNFIDAASYANFLMHEWAGGPLHRNCLFNGKCEFPDCSKIYATTLAQGGDKALARKRYFTIYQMQKAHEFYTAAYNLLERLQHELRLEMSDFARFFHFPHSDGRDSSCQLYAAFAKVALQLLGIVTFGGIDFSVGYMEVAQHGYLLKYALASPRIASDYEKNVLPLGLGQDLESMVCAKYAEHPKDAHQQIDDMLDNDFANSIEVFQQDLERSHAGLFRGDGMGANGKLDGTGLTQFAQIVRSGDFFNFGAEGDPLVADIEKVKAYFNDNLVYQAVLASMTFQMCGIVCSRTREIAYPTTLTISTARFQPDNGIICQAQCWSNSWDTANQPLYGIELIENPENRWRVALQDLYEFSYRSWKEDRYEFRSDKHKLSVASFLKEDATTFTAGLPICMSPMKPADFYEHTNNKEKVLPCVCGDEYGNETLSYLDAINIDKWIAVKYYKDDNPMISISQACQTSFEHDHTNPLSIFWTYCQLGTHFPLWGNNVHGDYFQPGRDPRCIPFIEEWHDLRRKQMSHHDVTCIMCFNSEIGNEIKQVQDNTWVTRGPNGRGELFTAGVHNFRRSCWLYNREVQKCGKYVKNYPEGLSDPSALGA